MLATPSPVPLDFLVNGTTFLRASLADHLSAAGLSTEATITLTYVRSLVPPQYDASFPHDDWVSAVDLLSSTCAVAAAAHSTAAIVPERIASASYDGLVRIWDPSGVVRATAAGHSRRLNAVKWLSPTALVSAGGDQKLLLWDYVEPSSSFSSSSSSSSSSASSILRPRLELFGHSAMVTALDVHPSSNRILTACADGSIGLWSTSRKEAPAADPALIPTPQQAKRARKMTAAAAASSSSSSSTAPAQGGAPQRGPLAIMSQLHTEPATAVVFHPADRTVAYSAAHDRTLRTIDLTTHRCVSTITTLHPLLCAAPLPRSAAGLVAVGSAARHVALLDPREAGARSSAALTLRGHLNMVSAVAAAPSGTSGGDYALVSGSHDGTCKVWDLRSVRPGRADEGGGSVAEPVYSIPREWLRVKNASLAPAGTGAKVLTVAWDESWGIVSAGEDKQVQVNRGREA